MFNHMKKELQRWFPIEKTMLKGTSKVVESKNICNFAPLIEVFMQDWFEKEEGTEHVPPSTFKGVGGCMVEQIRQHLHNIH